jgi:hypothetical protein
MKIKIGNGNGIRVSGNGDFNLANYVPLDIQNNTLKMKNNLKFKHAELDFETFY